MIKHKNTDTVFDIFIKSIGMIISWPIVLFLIIFCDFKVK